MTERTALAVLFRLRIRSAISHFPPHPEDPDRDHDADHIEGERHRPEQRKGAEQFLPGCRTNRHKERRSKEDNEEPDHSLEKMELPHGEFWRERLDRKEESEEKSERQCRLHIHRKIDHEDISQRLFSAYAEAHPATSASAPSLDQKKVRHIMGASRIYDRNDHKNAFHSTDGHPGP